MSDEHANAFSAQLRRLRLAAGLTQEELAERAGLTAAGVSALERGHRRRPYAHTVQALATALGLPDDERWSLLSRRRPDPHSPLHPVPVTSFVGRHAELRAVIERLRAAEQGQGGLVLLAGEPGIGQVTVDVATRHVRITYDQQQTSPERLRARLSEIGYPAAP